MPLRKSKAEKREERKLLRNIRFEEEKKVRFAEGLTTSTTDPRNPWIPTLEKNPRIPIPVDNYKNTLFEWCITRADREGRWSWGETREWSDEEYLEEIEGNFNNLLGNNWIQIETATYNGAHGQRKLLNKYQQIEYLCPEAQGRWNNDLDLGQFDQLFRFRRGGKKRIWGVRLYNHFFLIWYERKHKICPPKN
jgi:hypothetical protein